MAAKCSVLIRKRIKDELYLQMGEVCSHQSSICNFDLRLKGHSIKRFFKVEIKLSVFTAF